MGAASLSPGTRGVTEQDLLNMEFSTEQVERLSALRRAYPFIEYVDTAKEWRHLEFLKWRFDTGRIRGEA